MIKKRMVTDRSGKYNYWATLRRVRNEYIKSLGDVRAEDPTAINNGFYDYMQKTYGIKIHFVDSYISADFDVVDEKKYMLYQIKYA